MKEPLRRIGNKQERQFNMEAEYLNDFIAALTAFTDGYGESSRLARKVNTSPQHISRLKQGETGSEDLRRRIAAVYKLTYQEFLNLGYKIRESEIIPSKQELISFVEQINESRTGTAKATIGFSATTDAEIFRSSAIGITEIIKKAKTILRSESPLADLLKTNITITFEAYEKMQRKQLELESKIAELEFRVDLPKKKRKR